MDIHKYTDVDKYIMPSSGQQLQFTSLEPLKAKKLSSNAKLPTRGTKDSAGYDLYSAENVVIERMGQKLIKTDISVEIPSSPFGPGTAMAGVIQSRSGWAVKKGIEKGAGLIDQDYRGPIGVLLHNHSDKPVEIKQGDRIAQMVLIPVFIPPVVEVEELDETDRGSGGFGSTGM